MERIHDKHYPHPKAATLVDLDSKTATRVNSKDLRMPTSETNLSY